MASALKEKIRHNEVTVGSWITIGNSTILEIMIDAGFDWLVLDLEHSMMSTGEVSSLLALAHARKFPALVRLTSNDPDQAKRVLDAGADGIVVPMVKNRKEMRAAISSVKYPPLGSRGVGLSRAQGYGARFDEYVRNFNSDSIIIAQIEHIDAINDLPEILEESELDATIIGPYDLSGSLGKPGQFGDKSVADALTLYEGISRKKKVPMGYHIVYPNAADFKAKVDKGYRFFAYGVDFVYLGSACADALRSIREMKA